MELNYFLFSLPLLVALNEHGCFTNMINLSSVYILGGEKMWSNGRKKDWAVKCRGTLREK